MFRIVRIMRRAFSFEKKEILDYRRPPPKQITEQTGGTNCLVIHPVFIPNQGPEYELYRAEEAVGLAKALFWNITKGPFWQEEYTREIRMSQGRDPDDDPHNEDKSRKGRSEKDQSQLRKQMKSAGWEFSDEPHTKFRDGEYVYTPTIKGTYHKGGMYMNLDSTSASDDELFNEWKNKIIRTSIAKSSLMKIKRINGSHFFTKGKVQLIGDFIAENNIQALFVNTELSPLQSRNLERVLFRMINGKEVRFIRHNQDPGEETDYDTDAISSESDVEVQEAAVQPLNNQQGTVRHIKVFDRYTIILQIFAKRAKTGLAKWQIELSFLSFAKTKLVRSGTAFQSLSTIFEGDLMSAKEINVEVVNAKQRRAQGKMSGSGESQLEIQRRLINDKEAKIKKLIENENRLRQQRNIKRQNTLNSVPTIALIGYTNSGKSAIMNCIVKKEQVESKDRLFQTLSTTSKRIKLVSGQKAVLLDTIGFISDLPHDLVESFKSTLEEVESADIVLHIRDISHPCTEEQKKVVLQILKDLGFKQDFYSRKMIEVWNKIDLLKNPINFDDLQKGDYPVVPISATLQINIPKLLQTMEDKANAIMGKSYVHIKHLIDVHSDRLQWLYKNGNISGIFNEEQVEETVGKKKELFVKFDVLLDEVTYNRYKTTFQIETVKQRSSMPPPDWHLKKK